MFKDEIDFEVPLQDGKYTFVSGKDGKVQMLRYGKAWPAYMGKRLNNLEFACMWELHELQKKVKELETQIKEMATSEDSFDEWAIRNRGVMT